MLQKRVQGIKNEKWRYKFDKFENRDITVKLYAQFDSNSINLSKQNTVLLIPRNMTKSKPNKS